jgi:hypothetical protein
MWARRSANIVIIISGAHGLLAGEARAARAARTVHFIHAI